jgi:hypothetical protein
LRGIDLIAFSPNVNISMDVLHVFQVLLRC